MENQIKSKNRVTQFGEVNTSLKEINSMLDLVKQETERLDSRFFEPACGDGNFLFEVLKRKLKTLETIYKKNQYEFERNLIVVIGSIYGIDLLEDNVEATKKRLFNLSEDIYKKHFNKYKNLKLIQSLSFILNKNIVCGNALTLKHLITDEPITFCEWGIINNKLKRRDFYLSDLIAYTEIENDSLFSSMEVSIIQPLKIYSLVNYDEAFETC